MVRFLLIAALVFQGLSGLAGGFGLIGDPSGESVGLPTAWLEGSPFQSYLVPGLVLFAVLGIVPLVVGWAVWQRRARAHEAALLVGAALLVWIAVQITIVGYHPQPPLQAIYGGLGVAIVLLALLARTAEAP